MLNSYHYRDVILSVLAHFYESQDYVTKAEFQHFVSGFVNEKESSWAWIPLVPAVSRNDFEKEARNSFVADFQIWEFNENMERIKAGERDFYCPLFYVTENFGNSGGIGFDLASESRRIQALSAAMETGLCQLTDPLFLVTGDGSRRNTVIMLRSVFKKGRQEIAGFVAGALRVESFLANMGGNLPLELYFLRSDGTYELLGRNAKKPVSEAEKLYFTRYVFAFGRVFALRVYPDSVFLDRLSYNGVWKNIFYGFTLTALLALFFFLLVRRRDNLDALVRQRTAELRDREVQLKASYEELQREQEMLDLVISGTNAGVWEWNVQTGETVFNEIWAEIIGYKLSELQPVSIETWKNLTHPDDLRRCSELLEKHFRGESEFYEAEMRMRHKDGHWVWMIDKGRVSSRIEDGQPLLMHGTHQEISLRKKIEEELRLSRERYELAVSGSNDGIWDWNLLDNSLYLSAKWKEQLGYSDSELPNEFDSFEENIHPEDHQRVMDYAKQYLQGDSDFYQIDFRMRHKDGSYRWIMARGRSIRNESGTLVRMAGSHTDITNRKSAEVELREMNERLAEESRRANELAAEAEKASAAKSEFLANMSHEIRTPMNGIVNTVEFLRESSLNAEQRHWVDILHDCGQNLLHLLNAVLDISKIEAGKMELEKRDFDLSLLLDDMVAAFVPRFASKDVDLKYVRDERVPVFVCGDGVRLRQILVNLLENAFKFTDSGFVELKVSLLEDRVDELLLGFSVQDTGIGIPPEKQDILFDKFAQVDSGITRKYGGSGLGLSICRELVHLQGGEIGFDSKPDSGSRFWFSLSFDRVEKTASALNMPLVSVSQIKDSGLVSFKGKILLVEDNIVNQQVALYMLRKFGLTVEVVNNGAESLEKLRKNLYDLILMDVQMPVMDGITATEMIRKGDSGVLKIDVPVIALTAHAMREDRERCMAAGMDDYMHKPISVQRLSEMLKKWLPVQEGLQEEEESDQKEITEKIESSAIFNGGEETEKPAVFDSDGMLSRLTNDRELAQELVVMVIESFPENLSALEEAIEDQNPKNLMLAAHALKGLAANVGAERLRMVALELEKSGRSGEISGAGSILSEIKVQMELFRQESRWFLSDNP